MLMMAMPSARGRRHDLRNVRLVVDLRMDLERRLHHEEQARHEQHHVAPGQRLAEDRDDRRGQRDEPGEERQGWPAGTAGRGSSPKMRAMRACFGGSLAPISDTKITLSMPRTISIAVSVARASQPEGVKIQSNIGMSRSCVAGRQVADRGQTPGGSGRNFVVPSDSVLFCADDGQQCGLARFGRCSALACALAATWLARRFHAF